PEDRRVVTAPAMRIAVVDFLLSKQGVVRLQDTDDDRVCFPYGFADQFFGKNAACTLGVEKTALAIDRAIGCDPILLADDVILLSMTGRGMDRSGALFERDVIGKDAKGIAIEEGMAENRPFQA